MLATIQQISQPLPLSIRLTFYIFDFSPYNPHAATSCTFCAGTPCKKDGIFSGNGRIVETVEMFTYTAIPIYVVVLACS